MLKNKKGAVFWYIILMGVILIIVLLLVKNTKPSVNYIGEKPLQIISTSLEFEKHLYYTDQSGKLSAYQSIYDLTQNGGFGETEKCGKFNDYNLLNDKNNES